MKIINVIAAIIKKNNKVFITQRGHGEFKGKWVYPSEIDEKDFMDADKSVLDNLKSDKFKAFGALHKYANPDLIGKERELMAEAIAEKYKNV